MHRLNIFIGIILLLFVVAGCSGNGTENPIIPEENTVEAAAGNGGSHALWGLWQFRIDPVAKDIEMVPLREAMLHLNTLPFLEPPPFLYLSIESELEFNGSQLDVDVGLRHPFLGLNEFTGFDVRGILISKGNKSGFSDSGLQIAWEGATRLLNADGHTRWWNPTEFPYNPVSELSGYKDGLLGTPDSQANFTATLKR